MKKICKCGCGKEIIDPKYNSKFFNRNHSQRYYNRMKKKDLGNEICIICKIEFKKKSVKQKTCRSKECQRQLNLINHARYQAKHKYIKVNHNLTPDWVNKSEKYDYLLLSDKMTMEDKKTFINYLREYGRAAYREFKRNFYNNGTCKSSSIYSVGVHL